MINEELKPTIETTIQALDKARKAAQALAKAKDPSLTEALSLVEKAIDSGRAVRGHLDQLLNDLEHRRSELRQLSDEALLRRREELLRAAESAGWRARRLQNYDYVGCFRVNYRRARVTLQIGSETWGAFDEADGQKVFARIREAKEQLDGFPFDREAFFKAVKEAIGLARIKGLDCDGKVPIRKLYPLVVLVRQPGNDAFFKRPEKCNFREYSMCQFLYDLARFGEEGWRVRSGERLASQTPNMATIASGKALTLPALSRVGQGAQVATVWIEKV